MRGTDARSGSLFSYVDLEVRVPKDHPLRVIRLEKGAEMAKHAELRMKTGLRVYFCDPRSPWQRGSNENTDGLVRQRFQKGTDLAAHGDDELAAVAHALNARPRKTLGWKTPADALDEILRPVQKDHVATTG